MRFLHMPHLASKQNHHLGFPKSCFLRAQLDEKEPNQLSHFQTSATSTLVIKRSKFPRWYVQRCGLMDELA